MKTLATALTALALAATIPTSAFADELANPVQGAVQKLYSFRAKQGSKHTDSFKALSKDIKEGREAPCKVSVDTSDNYVPSTDSGASFGMWTGYIKRQSGGAYTFTFTAPPDFLYPMYSVWINGRQIVSAGQKTVAVDVVLNAGFNEFCIIIEGKKNKLVTIDFKKQGSLKEPKTLTPGDLWHEDEPDDEDEEDDD